MVDDILEGIFCNQCGQFIGEAVGYPRKCSDCELEEKNHQTKQKKPNTGNLKQQTRKN